MTAAIGVLCARVRVEEKQLLTALAEAGVPAMPLAPAACPYPFASVPSTRAVERRPADTRPTGQATAPTAPIDGAEGVEVVIDRLADRTLAAALLPLWQARGKVVLGAGLAATGNRAVVAAALAAAGLPRPVAFLAVSEEAAVAALRHTGYPATLLPLEGAPITLWDNDTAEAVLEHRSVLGDAADAVALIQTGAPTATERVRVHVVGGEAVAVEDAGQVLSTTPAIVVLARAAALALGASVVAVEIALTPAGVVVWDVLPAADFRHAVPLDGRGTAAAIAALAASHLVDRPAFERSVRVQVHAEAGGRDGIDGDAEAGPGPVLAVIPPDAGEGWREVGRDAAVAV